MRYVFRLLTNCSARGTTLIEIGCWAHARRYFFDAQDCDPVRTRLALLLIGKLYDVERRADAHYRERAEARLPTDPVHRL